MSYAIIRNANYKRDNLAGIYKHNERKNTNYSNKDIDKTNSFKNYSIKQCNTTYNNAIKILQQEYNLKGRIIKTTNIACEFIITSDKEFFETIGEQETKRYFQTAYNFVSNYNGLNGKYILSAKVHLDETTPHMHLVFIPVVHTQDKNGNNIDKIACSEFWKGKDSYRNLQDDFYKYITEHNFNLERGQARNTEHLKIETLKQITNYNNIKYELEQEDIKPINPQNTNLILKQNQELLKHNKKLKKYLAQSYISLNNSQKLQQENNELKREIFNLKQKIAKLTNYISKTFEVVNLLFDFPISSLRNVVNNFIKTLEKTKQ